MAHEHRLNWTLEFNAAQLRRRLLEVTPGVLSWGTLITLTILAFRIPFWIAIFIIIYDVYILIRGVYMSVHLIYAYGKLKKMKTIDWLERCQKVTAGIAQYQQEVEQELNSLDKKANPVKHWQSRQLKENLADIKRKSVTIMDWQKVQHVIIFPTYDESLEVLRTSIKAIVDTTFPKERLHIVVGFEERAGQAGRDRAAALTDEFGQHFGTFLTTFHPDGLPGEKRVKSANATWAVREMEQVLQKKNILVEDVLVSNFDSDTVVGSTYFSHLTYAFITHHDRYHVSYQPLPMYNNNLWDAPAFSRIIATGSTFWQMIESTRPERLVTFSSHSMTLRALKDVGYWHKDIISEDSRIFWQCLVRYDGHYATEPLYTSVSMDAALADSWWQTLVNQYKQKRRWGWGIENFPYMAIEFFKNKRMPFRIKATYLFRTLEGHYSWATAPIIVAGLGWLPVLFGTPQFQTIYLSYSLPFTARGIMSVAMLGLIISTTLSLMLLPAKPKHHSRWRYLSMSLQWALFPLIATILSAFPALDAETRLMLGRDLEFNVMKKSRKEEA